MGDKGTYYITTPIYYPSDKLHIGHAYTTVAADALARWNRFKGKDVFFLTGTDEHGQKIERKAKEKGVTPQAYVDEIVASVRELWELLDVEFDDFIRTTEDRHEKVVQEVFRRIYDKGDIYKGEYEGWYCTPCETFWPETKLEDGTCPDCGREVELVKEESYFFKISKYSGRLLKYIEDHPDFIQPPSRRNEMISFIRSGLEDLCVSRTTFDWGIPVPIDQGHVIYVWFDALTNYITGAGFLQDDAKFEKYWPADVHLVGKEIVRFHTIIWPIILMALDLPLPKKVFGHGWLLFDSDKMSKSKGNVVDPNILVDEFGVDPIRYFLLREVAFGQDGNFSRQALIDRTNADLANDLGNSLHRSLAMLRKYFDGVVPEPVGDETGVDADLKSLAETTVKTIDQLLDRLQINVALAEFWKLIRRVNKYIDETEPWALARADNTERLQTVMYNVFEALRIVALTLRPFLPRTSVAMWQQLGIETDVNEEGVAQTGWGQLKPGTETNPGQPIFPRIDVSKEKEGDALKPQPERKAKRAEKDALKPEITIDDFAKMDLRLAKIVAAEPVKGADKLLKLQVDLGGEQRQVVAGIAKHYDPSVLVGKQIIIVANLKPVKLRGELSQGMILAASDADDLAIVTIDPERQVSPGSRVK